MNCGAGLLGGEVLGGGRGTGGGLRSMSVSPLSIAGLWKSSASTTQPVQPRPSNHGLRMRRPSYEKAVVQHA
ncbi:hypothetical protein E2C01_067045 [Portunus trituberculatus]|uniref:Uncharacterized protein n=1 Tax=Portunus trituberculatus TaxID=210409 RepID=A0A5B7HRL8_PORTR|nr:hypothetical protein [Portunus trituberculatus]